MTEKTFYHASVLLHEAVDGLAIKPEGIYVDATFGGGGHSKAILQQLGQQGKLVVFDQDEDAWRNLPNDSRVVPVHENFRYLKQFLRLHGIDKVDGILADLGVSSHQFDTGERGFSIRFEGPLDMRMDKRGELTAASVLKNYSELQLHKIFEQYGEVRNAKQLAKHIVTNRKGMVLNNISSLKALIAPVMRGNPNKYLAQMFQALRIEVNDELGALQALLQQAALSLKSGGRLCVITFHSLEDRMVKHYIKRGDWEEQQSLMGNEMAPVFKAVNVKSIVPGVEEIKNNSRARSARLRIAEKI